MTALQFWSGKFVLFQYSDAVQITHVCFSKLNVSFYTSAKQLFKIKSIPEELRVVPNLFSGLWQMKCFLHHFGGNTVNRRHSFNFLSKQLAIC